MHVRLRTFRGGVEEVGEIFESDRAAICITGWTVPDLVDLTRYFSPTYRLNLSDLFQIFMAVNHGRRRPGRLMKSKSKFEGRAETNYNILGNHWRLSACGRLAYNLRWETEQIFFFTNHVIWMAELFLITSYYEAEIHRLKGPGGRKL